MTYSSTHIQELDTREPNMPLLYFIIPVHHSYGKGLYTAFQNTNIALSLSNVWFRSVFFYTCILMIRLWVLILLLQSRTGTKLHNSLWYIFIYTYLYLVWLHAYDMIVGYNFFALCVKTSSDHIEITIVYSDISSKHRANITAHQHFIFLIYTTIIVNISIYMYVSI